MKDEKESYRSIVERLLLALGQPTRPEWTRLPKEGLCPWSSLSRTKLNSLILGDNPPVKSVSLRKRGQIKGTRLIHLPSLLEYLHAQMEAPTPDVRPELPVESMKGTDR